MSIIVVGVGAAYKEKEAMNKIAGSKGKVLLYPNFDKLSDSLDEIMEKTCGELVF